MHAGIASVLILYTLASLGCRTAVPATDDFQELSPDTCVSLASSKLKVTLASEWQPYLAATRVCPLAKPDNAKPDIFLVAIFGTDYYRGKSVITDEHFPKPILFTAKGERVGELEGLFPASNFYAEDVYIVEMILTYGRWQGNIPGEIRMRVLDPTVTGDHNLPTLLWSREKKRYIEGSTPPFIDADGLQELLPNSCVPLASTTLKAPLAPEWKPYLSLISVCPLVKQRGAKPDILLMIVSYGDYNRSKPGEPVPEDLPKSLLINSRGERVGELKELFPYHVQHMMTLSYGHWQGNIPGKIKMRMHITKPGQYSNHYLPTLLWNKEKQRYVEQAE